MFHQIEGLVIDKRIHMGHLKWTLETFLKAFFERDDIVLRSLGPDAPRRTISIATLGCGYEAPAVEPMRAVLRRVAHDHCFSCDACVV